MTVVLSTILSLYCILVLTFIFGFARMRNTRTGNGKIKTGVSVLVACRNEEHNMPDLVKNLAAIDYPTDKFEVILIDDHSTDGTLEIMKQSASSHSNFRVLALSAGEGKKRALMQGIASARFDVIATTDADCRVPADWVSYISLFMENPSTHLLMGAVAVQGTDLFSALQSMEFSTLMGSSLAAAGWGHPVMCNGANLAFRKKTFIDVNGYEGNLHLASGDDEFLMRKIVSRYPNSIGIINYPEAVVTTPSQKSFRDFVHQRLRWASKWKHNPDFLTKLLAVFILIGQTAFVLMPIWVLTTPQSFYFPVLAFSIFLMKEILEFIFVVKSMRFLRQKPDLETFVCLEVLYPLYVLGIGTMSLFSSYDWKGRLYK